MDHHGLWTLTDLQGDARQGLLRRDSRLLPFAVLLRFDLVGGGTRSVLVFRDSVHADELRQLRQLLRVYSSRLLSLKG